MEIWQDVVGWEGKYWVSSFGNIKNSKKVLSKVKISRDNYYKTILCSNNKRKAYSIHRLVAISFIPNPENKCCVNHKNGDKLDNRVENLEWVTLKENVKHALETGLSKIRGSDNKCSKLKEEDVLKIFDSKEVGATLAVKFNISISTIRAIKTGRIWKHLTNKEFQPKKLDEKIVIEIFSSSQERKTLSSIYNISRSVVDRIKNKQMYKKILKNL